MAQNVQFNYNFLNVTNTYSQKLLHKKSTMRPKRKYIIE
jgi:hypothetical protein